MMGRKARMSLVLVLGALFLLFPLPVKAATVDGIASQLICQCGCTAVLNNCTHVECHVRGTMTAAITQSLEQGKSPEQIVASFVVQYGEPVLAAPPKRGFNLTAWLLPFLAIILGGGVIYVSIKKWLFKGSQVSVPVEGAESDEYWRRVEKELSDFSEGSFR